MDLNQFWNLVSESRLFPPEQLTSIQTQFQSEILSNNATATSANAAQWLVDTGLITDLQSEIIQAGHSGPFIFGNYVVEEKCPSPLLPNSFLAVHRLTNHPVLLQFKPGGAKKDLAEWQDIEQLAERARAANSPFLTPVFEPVVLPNHRMVVSGRPFGEPLSQKLPRKSRMAWKDACLVFSQVSKGLHELHENGIVHNAVSPRTIWLDKGGLAQLRLAVFPDEAFETPDINQKYSESRLDYMAPEAYVETTIEQPKLSRQSDLYALGCTLFRAVTGRVLFEEPDIPKKRRLHASATIGDLDKYQLPEEFEKLLRRLLAKNPDARPDNAGIVGELLARQTGGSPQTKPVPGVSEAISPSLTRLRAHLKKWEPGSGESLFPTEGPAVQLDLPPEETVTNVPAAERIQAAKARSMKRKNSKWVLPAAILGALIFISSTVGLIVYLTNSAPAPVLATNDNDKGQAKATTSNDSVDPATGSENGLPIQPVRFVQDLIQDDRVTLWESPTNRRELQLSYLPSSPKLVFTALPQAILGTADGPRTLDALGPVFSKSLDAWQNRIGLELQDIQRVTVTLHSTSDLKYDFFFQVELPETVAESRLLELWSQPERTPVATGQTLFKTAENNAFFPIPSGINGKHQSFVYGPTELVEQVIVAKGATAWSGTMRRLASWIDADQHFSFLFLRPALFNDEGQWLMSGQLSQFNEGLDETIDDQIRGGILSMHLAEGTFLEFRLEHNTDLKAKELKDRLDERFRRRRDLLATFYDAAPSDPFWDQVRRKSPLMFADLYGNLRIAVEYGDVTGNCWLPPMAAHNLIASAELATSFSTGSTAPAIAAGPKTPATLEELLQKPRNLSVTTSPDMNILLSSIEQEVIDDYGGLPFEFHIRLMGNDLSKEGITQNQRPNDFEMKQTSLADILTEIMVQCNPKKDIDGPSDPDCKLIWVVAEDPESPGNQAVLITTRAAAELNGYTLPPAFRKPE